MGLRQSRKCRCFFGLAHFDVHRVWNLIAIRPEHCGIHPHSCGLVNPHVPTYAHQLTAGFLRSAFFMKLRRESTKRCSARLSWKVR
jgi:hypothetical protein